MGKPTTDRPFEFGCSTAVFPPEEIAALESCGRRLEALASGEARPESPEEEHFLKVDREEVAPRNVRERAWLRLKGRREFEQEQRAAKPPVGKEDYGIQDWDHDRCWW